MSTTTSITTTYAGEFKQKIVSAALLASNTIDKGGIEVKPGIKFKEVIKRLSTDDILKNATCDFDATSTITLTEKILQPKEMQVNLQLCKKDFHSDWLAMEQGLSAFDTLPKSFADYLVAHIAAKVAAKNEKNIWSGVASNGGEFDGFATLLSLDPDLPTGQEITGSSAIYDADTVVAELGKIVDAIPDTLYGREDLYIYISQAIYRAYTRALGGYAANGVGANGYNNQGNNQSLGDLMFDGVKLFVANGLDAGVAIATTKDNLYFGTGLMADMNEVKVIDLADIDGSENVRVVMRLTAGVQYGVVEDIVTYGIVNDEN